MHLALVATNEDFVILVDDVFCVPCATRKLNILRIMGLTHSQANELKQYKLRFLKIRCDCGGKK